MFESTCGRGMEDVLVHCEWGGAARASSLKRECLPCPIGGAPCVSLMMTPCSALRSAVLIVACCSSVGSALPVCSLLMLKDESDVSRGRLERVLAARRSRRTERLRAVRLERVLAARRSRRTERLRAVRPRPPPRSWRGRIACVRASKMVFGRTWTVCRAFLGAEFLSLVLLGASCFLW